MDYNSNNNGVLQGGKRLRGKLPRETLMKELERERLLRVDAEQRLRDITIEKDTSKTRLQNLSDEFRKMEEMVKNVVQYKSKIEQLKEEKASLSVSYEKTMQKYTTLLGNLEQENKLLLAENKRIESQCSNCEVCNKDLHYRVTKPEPQESSAANDRVKVLLERLKKVEEEKSQLVLENETQRQQYEKCLDEIANQVVQALLSQKTLREECSKLRKRVLDLEDQNKQLSLLFQQRIKFASDSVLQSMAHKRLAGQAAGGSSGSSLNNLTHNAQHPMGAAAAAALSSPPYREGENAATPFSEFSLDSLHSMCSDYAQSGQLDEEDDFRDLGKAKPSSPPPWVRDKLFHGSPTSSTGSSCHLTAQQDHMTRSKVMEHAHLLQHSLPVCSEHAQLSLPAMERLGEAMASEGGEELIDATSPEVDEQSSIIKNVEELKKRFFHMTQAHRYGSKVETEFPATNDSPKMRHVNRIPHTALVHNRLEGKSAKVQNGNRRPLENDVGGGEACASDSQFVMANNMRPGLGHLLVSPGEELLNIRDSFHERYAINEEGFTRIQNNLFSESDTDSDASDSQNAQNKSSMGSTISLNELLEQGLDGVQTPADDTFSIDNFHMFDSEDEREDHAKPTKLFSLSASNTSKPLDFLGVLKENPTPEDESVDRKCCASQTSPELENSCECGSAVCKANSPSTSSGTNITHAPPPLLPKPTLQRPNSLELVSKKSVGEYANCYSSEGEDDHQDTPKPAPASSQHPHPFRLRHPVLTAPPPPTVPPPEDSEDECLDQAAFSPGEPLSPSSSRVAISSPSPSSSTGSPKKVPPPTKPKPKRETTQDSGILLLESSSSKTDIAIETDHSQDLASSASPDSAMQQSFSSTSSTVSDIASTMATFDKTSKDDGYSSNSTPSVTSGELSTANKLDTSPDSKHLQADSLSPLQGQIHPRPEILGASGGSSNDTSPKVAKIRDLKNTKVSPGLTQETDTAEKISPGAMRRLCGPGESDVSIVKSPRSPPSYTSKVPFSCPPTRRMFGSPKQQPLYVLSPTQSYNSHSDTCVYRPYFYRRPHYRRMCSQASRQGFESPANKLFRTLSDSALHRNRFRYTDRIVHNIFQSLKAISQMKSRSKIVPGSSGVDHPECRLITRHSKMNGGVNGPSCQRGTGFGGYNEPTVGYMLVETRVPRMEPLLLPAVRTLGEGSENGYKSREDMRPDGKTCSAELLESSSPKPGWLLWSSDSEDEEQTKPVKKPFRLHKNHLQVPAKKSPQMNIRTYISPTDSNSRDLRSPDGSSSDRIEIVHSPIPSAQPDLLSGTVFYKPSSPRGTRLVSEESTPSPDDGSNPIEESVRLLNNVGVANGIVELEKEYKNMQEQHFRCKKRKCSRPDSDDHGYFDTETISNNQNANSDEEEDQGDFSEDIENLSKTVNDLQKSLSSLNELEAEENDNEEPPPLPPRRTSLLRKNVPPPCLKKNNVKRQWKKKPVMGSRIKKMHVESSDSEKDLDTTEVVDTTDADSRANFLDRLVMLSSSSEEEDYVNGGVVMGQAAARLKRDQQCAMRCPLPQRPTISNQQHFFTRYGEHEKSAIKSFAFLHDLSPSHSPYQSDSGEEGQGEVAEGQGQQCGECSQNEDTSIGELTKADIMKNLRLHPPKNPRVSQLLQESRQDVDVTAKNRLSTDSFESVDSSFGVDGLSLSDSCCQSFSSSDGSNFDISSL